MCLFVCFLLVCVTFSVVFIFFRKDEKGNCIEYNINNISIQLDVIVWLIFGCWLMISLFNLFRP